MSCMVSRATAGWIRCQDNGTGDRLACLVEGPGELLVDGGNKPSVVRMSDATSYTVHIPPNGDVACAEPQ